MTFTLYYNIFKMTYGELSGDAMLCSLQAQIDDYNKQQGEICTKLSKDGNQTIIAICSPLMKRVHRLVRHSAEIAFADSSGNCDRMNSRIFLLLTHSAAGGLPLGVVTTSEVHSTISARLSLSSFILPQEAFFGRGELGPQVFMTDNCKALRQALLDTYPNTHPILCVFHILQAMWRWLWDSHNGVPKTDRQHLLNLFKQLVYAKCPLDLETSYHQAVQDSTARKHLKYTDHLVVVYRNREAWALCLRSHLPTRGNYTNNFVESAMRVLKEQVFHRLKAYNIIQLVDFIVTRLEAYYTRRLIDVANNRTTKKQPKPTGQVRTDGIIKEDEVNFTVPSASTYATYNVNMSLGNCTCPDGSTGAFCCHQHAVMQVFHIQDNSPFASATPSARKLFYQIATGRLDIPETWFMGLQFEREDCPTVPLNASTQEQAEMTTPPAPQHSGAEEASSQSESVTECLEGHLRSMFDGLIEKLTKDETFQAPIESLVSSYEKIQTDSSLISALSTFGKIRSAAARSIKMQPRKGLQMSTQIGVQPTAAARRKTPLGGRRSLITGRPPKRARREHNYGKVKEGSGALPRRPAPHSLAQCVSAGVSLGGQHSKK